MTDLTIGGSRVRRDGEMWCLTDLWRAAGSPSDKRPAEYLRKEGASFAEFLSASLDVPQGHIKKSRKIGGGGGETWTHWQLALAFAKWMSHEFHARVNEVYRAFTAGQLGPTARASDAERELLQLTLRLKAMERNEYESVWDLELKLELARLRKLPWTGEGVEPKPLAYAYGRTWRLILGDAVYEELKRRNPHPKDGSLHGQWLQEQRLSLARRENLVVALVLARRCRRWAEYEAEMRAHFRRAPLQLRLVQP